MILNYGLTLNKIKIKKLTAWKRLVKPKNIKSGNPNTILCGLYEKYYENVLICGLLRAIL